LRLHGLLFVFGLAVAGSRGASGDVVTTTDGKTHEGKVVEDGAERVVIETTFDGRKELPRATVKRVDTSVPPLREQLDYRTKSATDAKSLLDAAAWAKSKGFKDEVVALHERVIALEPENARARKALGHVKVGGKWMTPKEKEAAEAASREAEMKAKGLVFHDGRWMPPEEKDALERGLRKDGDAWVTEDEWHRRRGERKVGGQWVRVGEAEGRARAAALSRAIGTPLQAMWGPHLDVFHEIPAADAKIVLEAAEKAFLLLADLLAPGPEPLHDLRVQILLFDKATPYANFVEHFAKEQGIAAIKGQENWSRMAARQKSFWWPDPVATTAQYAFPNPVKNLASGVVHNLATILVTKHRFNYRFASPWLQEGLAYWTEAGALGYSDTYTIGRGGEDPGDPAPWQDAKRWRLALKGAVSAGRDPAVPRLADAQSIEAFGLVELVKAWSVVDLLVRLDRKKFKAFVDGTKTRGTPEEDALKAAYGFDYRGLENRWRQFVEAGFQT
jgi:hypothetical protein